MKVSQPFLLFLPVLALNLRYLYALLRVKLSVDAQEATDALVFACFASEPGMPGVGCRDNKRVGRYRVYRYHKNGDEGAK